VSSLDPVNVLSVCFEYCSPLVQWDCNRYNVTKVLRYPQRVGLNLGHQPRSATVRLKGNHIPLSPVIKLGIQNPIKNERKIKLFPGGPNWLHKQAIHYTYKRIQFPVSNVNCESAVRFTPGASGLHYHHAPLVCVPKVSGGLAVWWLTVASQTNKQSSPKFLRWHERVIIWIVSISRTQGCVVPYLRWLYKQTKKVP